MIQFNTLADKILNLDEDMRYVEVFDNQGKIVFNKKKITKQSFTMEKEETLATDFSIVRRIYEIFDETLGQVSSIRITREKIHQFVFYAHDHAVYISCERKMDDKRVDQVFREIESLLKTG